MVLRVWVAGTCVFLALTGNTLRSGDLSPAELAWLRSHAIEISTVEAGNGFADLEKLPRAIASAHIVSLGEATHGTREIHQLRHRLVEFLASQGPTIFALEANMPEAYRMNDYVLHGNGDPKALLDAMRFWTVYTAEVLGMVEWMRQVNASGRGHVEFTGFDMQTPKVALQNVREFLAATDTEYEKVVAPLCVEVADLREAVHGFGVVSATIPVRVAAGHRIRFSAAIRTENVAGGRAALFWRADGAQGPLVLDDMGERGADGTTGWNRYELAGNVPSEATGIGFGALMSGTGTAWFDDMRVDIDGVPYDATAVADLDFESGRMRGFSSLSPQYIVATDDRVAARGTCSLKIATPAETSRTVVHNSEVARRWGNVVAHMAGARQQYLQRADARTIDWAIQSARLVHQFVRWTASETSRDESMAENVRWIVDNAPRVSRVVLWAHNRHVSRTRIAQFRPMGSYLDRWYGKRHVVVGFTCNRGEYTAFQRGAALGQYPLKTAEPGSYEYLLAQAGISQFVLDLRDVHADASSAWLLRRMQLRSIGALAGDQQFFPADLSREFDFVVFLDRTTATRGLWQTR